MHGDVKKARTQKLEDTGIYSTQYGKKILEGKRVVMPVSGLDSTVTGKKRDFCGCCLMK